MKIAQINKKNSKAGVSAVVTPSSTKKPANKTTSSVNTNKKASPQAHILSHEQIAERARAIWVSKGCIPGHDTQNWMEAEAQLKAEMAGTR